MDSVSPFTRELHQKGGDLLSIEKAFGLVLRKYRQQMSLSQEELSHRCDLDRTFISLLERGLRRPTLNTIFILAKNLNITPTILIQEVENIVNESNQN